MTPKKRLGHVPFCEPALPTKCALKGCQLTRIPPTSFCRGHQGRCQDTCDNMPALSSPHRCDASFMVPSSQLDKAPSEIHCELPTGHSGWHRAHGRSWTK
jgi:hypothetical protein